MKPLSAIIRQVFDKIRAGDQTSSPKVINYELRQCFVAVGPLILTLGLGMTSGYSAILLPQLNTTNSTIQINQNEASWIASLAVLPMIIGCLLAAPIMSNFGLKATHLATIAPSMLGWPLIAFSYNSLHLFIGRILTGVGGGLLGASTAAYISETASPPLRPLLLGAISLAVALGLLLVHLLGTFLNWRTVALISTFPPLIGSLPLLFAPESPFWLARSGYNLKATGAFYWLRGNGEGEGEEWGKVLESVGGGGVEMGVKGGEGVNGRIGLKRGLRIEDNGEGREEDGVRKVVGGRGVKEGVGGKEKIGVKGEIGVKEKVEIEGRENKNMIEKGKENGVKEEERIKEGGGGGGGGKRGGEAEGGEGGGDGGGRREIGREEIRIGVRGRVGEVVREGERVKCSDLLKREFLRPLAIILVYITANQCVGVNAITFYSIEILQQTLGPSINSYFAMLLIDTIRFLTSILACYLMSRFRRRSLALLSACGTAISLFVLTAFDFAVRNEIINEKWTGFGQMVALMGYIGFVTVGFVPLPWAMMGEVFPMRQRSFGTSLCSLIAFSAFFGVVKTSPALFERWGSGGAFAGFGGVAAGCAVFLWAFLPETKGKTLGEIEEAFRGRRIFFAEK